ncbi:MAG: hypothetical protein U9P80_03415 [Thermodesulfobacteriota bacterium]|nr:hypothetical protein [Thermodesulfobacteriota bacterium]
MEVKSIYVNNIMKAYEKPQSPGKAQANNEARTDNGRHTDSVSISSRANQRLFDDMMEQSLSRSLNKDKDIITYEGG